MNAGVTVGGKNTIHGIRRMVATEMIKANQSVYTVSQILGHQSLKSTRQYIDLDVEGLRKCTLCFNDVIGDER
jgi:integrase